MSFEPTRTIPELTERFVRDNARSQQDVLRKLKAKYQIDDSDPQFDPRGLDYKKDLLNDRFKERIAEAADRTGVTDEQQLLDVCNAFAVSCAKLCVLRLVVLSKAKLLEKESRLSQEEHEKLSPQERARGRIAVSEEDARKIDNIYASHVIEEGLVKIRALLPHYDKVKDREKNKSADREAVSIAGCVISHIANATYLIEPYREARMKGEAIERWRDKVMGGLRAEMLEELNQENKCSRGVAP